MTVDDNGRNPTVANIKTSRRKAPRKSPIQSTELCWGFSFTRCWPIADQQLCIDFFYIALQLLAGMLPFKNN